MGQGQMLGNICTLEQIHSILISRELLALTDWLCPSQTGLPSSPPLENRCPTSQILTLFQHVLQCPFDSEVFPGKRAAHCAPDLPPHSPPRLSLPLSSHQQIQLTNLMLQPQKAKQLWKTDQVPWNSLSESGLGGLQADSGMGREAEQEGKCLPVQTAQEIHLGRFERYTHPLQDTGALADVVAPSLGIRIFLRPM